MKREGSPIMRFIYSRLRRFWRAVAVFYITVDTFVIIIFVFLCMPVLSHVFRLPPARSSFFIEGAAAWLGLFRIQAASVNLLIEAFSQRSAEN